MDSQTEVHQTEVGQGSGLIADSFVCKANASCLYNEEFTGRKKHKGINEHLCTKRFP